MKIKEMLNMLSAPERKALGADLEARRFGNEPGLVNWYHACVKLCDAEREWSENDLAKMMGHPQKGYVRQRQTALVRCVETFLEHIALDKDPTIQALCLLDEYRLRDPSGGYSIAYKEALRKLEQTPLRGFKHYAALLHMEEEHLFTPSIAGGHNHAQPLFQTSLDALDRAYALKKLGLACKAASQDRNRKTKHTLSMMDDLLRWIASMNTTKDPLIHLYVQLLELISDEQGQAQATFFEAKSFLQTNLDTLREADLPELQDAFAYLINYCIVCIKQGTQEFKDQLVALYDLLLPTGILETNGKLSVPNFRNIFVLLTLAENQTAKERLVTIYGGKVEGKTAKTTVLMCRGLNELGREQFEMAEISFASALQHLPLGADDQLEAEVLGLQARTCYELGDHKVALAKLQVLGKLLRRQRLSIGDKGPFKRYEGLCQELVEISKVPIKLRPPACDALALRLKAESQKVFCKEWLLAAISSLRNKKR